MASRPRSDIHINLPALQKLDTMLQVRQAPSAELPGLFGRADSEELEFCFTGNIRQLQGNRVLVCRTGEAGECHPGWLLSVDYSAAR